MNTQDREKITVRFYRMMAIAFNKRISGAKLGAFKAMSKKFDGALLPIKGNRVEFVRLIEMGRAAYNKEVYHIHHS